MTDTNGKIFVDTSAWIASFLSTEPLNPQMGNLLKNSISNKDLIYTSNDIINETYTRLRYDTGWHMAKKFLDYFRKAALSKSVIQLWTDEQIQLEAFRVLEKYHDHDLSLTDATSTVLMKNFRVTTAITTDRTHFSTLGFRVLP